MKLSEILKGNNKWFAIGVIAALYLFFSSSFSLGVKAFIIGNPCAGGQVYDSSTAACVPATSQISCGTGQFLAYSAQKGYSCEWSNLGIGILILAAGLIVYFFFLSKRSTGWIAPRPAFDLAFKNGHISFPVGCPAGTSVSDVYSTIRNRINQIEPKGAWAFTGWLRVWGMDSTLLINATTNPGWPVNSMENGVPYGHTTIQKESKKGKEPMEVLKEAKKLRDEFEEKHDKEEEAS